MDKQNQQIPKHAHLLLRGHDDLDTEIETKIMLAKAQALQHKEAWGYSIQDSPDR